MSLMEGTAVLESYGWVRRSKGCSRRPDLWADVKAGYGQLVPGAICGSLQTRWSSRPSRQKPMPSPRSRES